MCHLMCQLYLNVSNIKLIFLTFTKLTNMIFYQHLASIHTYFYETITKIFSSQIFLHKKVKLFTIHLE